MIKQSRSELLVHLQEQIYFWAARPEAFDAGFTPEAKRLASAVRALAHDYGSTSRGLLNQLGNRDLPQYADSCPDLTATTISRVVLASIGMTSTGLFYEADLEKSKPGRVFHHWWTKPAMMT